MLLTRQPIEREKKRQCKTPLSSVINVTNTRHNFSGEETTSCIVHYPWTLLSWRRGRRKKVQPIPPPLFLLFSLVKTAS